MSRRLSNALSLSPESTSRQIIPEDGGEDSDPFSTGYERGRLSTGYEIGQPLSGDSDRVLTGYEDDPESASVSSVATSYLI